MIFWFTFENYLPISFATYFSLLSINLSINKSKKKNANNMLNQCNVSFAKIRHETAR